MFTEILKEEIIGVKIEIEDLESLIEGEGRSGWERGELIDKRYKLLGKLAGLGLALEIYQENE